MVAYENFALLFDRKCMHLPAEQMIGTSLIFSNSNNYSKHIYSVAQSIARISISTNGYLRKSSVAAQNGSAGSLFCDELRREHL